jgi:preprotein translocase subunit SecG
MQFVQGLLYFITAILSLFLICLVLIQRGKGGGLAGAFGGAGGSSAFGTKAGDVFTRVTMFTALIWIALNMFLVVLSNRRTSAYDTGTTSSSTKFNPAPKDKGADASRPTLPIGPSEGLLEPGPGKAEPSTKSSGEPVAPVSGGSPTAPVPLPDKAPVPKS